MRTHILADDVVHVDLTADEHIALSEAIAGVLAELEPALVHEVLGLDAAEAADFARSIRVLERRAHADGIDWLTPGIEAIGEPVFAATFDELGCSWQITLGQLQFIEACTAEEHRRGEPPRGVDVNAA